MTAFTFKPAASFQERAGLFVSLTGSTNSGKTFSAMRLARGIAGPDGKIAVIDTEGGRTLHLKDEFAFDFVMMDPPFRPNRFSEAALAAEQAGYDALVIDSFSMEWVGLGGVLDWQAAELQRMAGDDFKKRERVKMASWIQPKAAHKQMVYSLLQRRIPIIFSIRGEEAVKPGEAGEKPTAIFKSITDKRFPFEVTVSFRLESDRKGYIDLSDPKSYKMEGSHTAIFKHGDRISEEHGAKLAKWARGVRVEDRGPPPIERSGLDEMPTEPAEPKLFTIARQKAAEGSFAFASWKSRLNDRQANALLDIDAELNALADEADERLAKADGKLPEAAE